jgi:hypothetical protein
MITCPSVPLVRYPQCRLKNGIMDRMQNIIQFAVSEESGVYTADGFNVPIVTEGRTFEELKSNIRDAVALYFEGDDPASLGFGPSPSILTNYEVSPMSHEGRA